MSLLWFVVGVLSTIINILFGIVLGYIIGNKQEKTLKQQVSRLKEKVRLHNRSAVINPQTPIDKEFEASLPIRQRIGEITNLDPYDVSLDVDKGRPDDLQNMF